MQQFESTKHSRYKKTKCILGEGSYKTVTKAMDEEEGKEVAYNEVRIKSYENETKTESSFSKEIALLKAIDHPNILKILDFWFSEENFIFVTELMTGGPLNEYVEKNGPLCIKLVRKWGRQILAGLVYLHTQDPPVIHRDIKNDNIFINAAAGEVKIGDLGLARERRSKRYTVVGTPHFMAREMFEGEGYTEKVDIYAFGMCLIEMATGRRPYAEFSDTRNIYKSVLQGVFPKGLEMVINPCLKSLIIACLVPSPFRFTSSQCLDHHFFHPDVHCSGECVPKECVAVYPLVFEPVKDMELSIIAMVDRTVTFQILMFETMKFIKFEFDLDVDSLEKVTQELMSERLVEKKAIENFSGLLAIGLATVESKMKIGKVHDGIIEIEPEEAEGLKKRGIVIQRSSGASAVAGVRSGVSAVSAVASVRSGASAVAGATATATDARSSNNDAVKPRRTDQTTSTVTTAATTHTAATTPVGLITDFDNINLQDVRPEDLDAVLNSYWLKVQLGSTSSSGKGMPLGPDTLEEMELVEERMKIVEAKKEYEKRREEEVSFRLKAKLQQKDASYEPGDEAGVRSGMTSAVGVTSSVQSSDNDVVKPLRTDTVKPLRTDATSSVQSSDNDVVKPLRSDAVNPRWTDATSSAKSSDYDAQPLRSDFVSTDSSCDSLPKTKADVVIDQLIGSDEGLKGRTLYVSGDSYSCEVELSKSVNFKNVAKQSQEIPEENIFLQFPNVVNSSPVSPSEFYYDTVEPMPLETASGTKGTRPSVPITADGPQACIAQRVQERLEQLVLSPTNRSDSIDASTASSIPATVTPVNTSNSGLAPVNTSNSAHAPVNTPNSGLAPVNTSNSVHFNPSNSDNSTGRSPPISSPPFSSEKFTEEQAVNDKCFIESYENSKTKYKINHSISLFVLDAAAITGRTEDTAKSWVKSLKEEHIETVFDLRLMVYEDWENLPLTVFASRAMQNMIYGIDGVPLKERQLPLNPKIKDYDNRMTIRNFLVDVCEQINRSELVTSWEDRLLAEDIQTVGELKSLHHDDWSRLGLSVYAHRILKNIILRKGRISIDE